MKPMPILPLPRLELSRFRGSRKSRAALVIIAVIPALYGGLFLSSNWNPTEHLDQLTAAVVNNDEPATAGTATVNAGKELSDNLVDSSSAGFTWKATSAAEAREGLEDGTYAATAVIPKTFSANITSVSGDRPEKAKIKVTTNDATSYVLGQVTNSVASGIESQVRTSTTKNYLHNIYVAFTDLHQQLTTAADGAQQLTDGATSARTGSGELVVGLDKLADGSVTLTTGAQTLASGAATAATGAATLSTGLNTLRDRTAALPAQTDKLKSGAQTAATGAGTLAAGASATADGASKVADGAAQTADGADQVAAGATQLTTGAGQVSDGAQQVADGAARLNTGAQSALAGAKSLQSGANTLAQNTPTLASGTQALSAGLSNLQQNYGSLTDTQRQAAIAQLSAAASQVSSGAGSVNTGAQQLSGGLDQFVGTADDGSSVSYLAAQTGTLATGAASVADGAAKTTAGATQVATGATKVADGARKTADGAEKTSAGATKVADGGTTLQQGLTTLADGTATLAEKMPALTAGIEKAADGAETLSAGTTTIASGAASLASGADTLSGGAQNASDGASALDTGIGKLQSGSEDLATGLADGADKIPSYSTSERTTLAGVASDPVTLDREHTNAVAAYGEGLAPYFMPLALWIGGIVTFLILRALSARGIASTASGWRVALSGYFTGALFGILQALILDAVLVFLVGLDSPYLPGVVAFTVLIALVFTAIHQALVALFGSPGRLVALILLMLQLASAGGTYPVATAPGFFQAISPYLPMTYAVQGLRRLIAGGDIAGVWTDAGVLALFGIGFVLLSILAVRRNRIWTIERLHPSLAI